MSNDSVFRATTAPLTDMLRQIALDIAQAQAALDAFAEAQAAGAPEAGAVLPALAFYFPEIEVDLRLGFTLTRFEGRQTLSVTPANPTASGFFKSTSFSSRLRARIAPRAALLHEEPSDE
ncbi:MAG: hypothetical protein H7Z42_00275 [Roseiflexaceae bacterium]|nr:hypothetical protein [Roseiflexaceae bacterium]